MKNILREFWSGNRPLWQAFWIWGVLGYIVLFILIFAFCIITVNHFDYKNPYFLALIGLPAIIFYFVSTTAAIWKCGEKSARAWKYLSRVYIILLIAFNIYDGYRIWSYWVPYLQGT